MSVLPRASRSLLGANGPVQTAGAPSSALLPGRQSRMAPPPPRRTPLHHEVGCTRAQEPPQSLPRVCRAPSPKTDNLKIARQTHSSQGLYVPVASGKKRDVDRSRLQQTGRALGAAARAGAHGPGEGDAGDGSFSSGSREPGPLGANSWPSPRIGSRLRAVWAHEGSLESSFSQPAVSARRPRELVTTQVPGPAPREAGQGVWGGTLRVCASGSVQATLARRSPDHAEQSL